MSFNLEKLVNNLSLFLWGCLISAISFLSIFLIEYAHLSFSLSSNVHLVDISKGLLYCLSVAIIEEFIFRYLFLKKWIKDKTKPFSNNVLYLGVVSSLIFGFLHLNMNEFPLMQINLVLSGISLFYAAYVFRNIAIVVGMHFSWNFIQGVIFPFEGSGSNLNSILVMESKINLLPEASPFMIVTTIVEIILVWWLSIKLVDNMSPTWTAVGH